VKVSFKDARDKDNKQDTNKNKDNKMNQTSSVSSSDIDVSTKSYEWFSIIQTIWETINHSSVKINYLTHAHIPPPHTHTQLIRIFQLIVRLSKCEEILETNS
jgi:hypothetical protein